jgi:hypothetical protein
MTPASPLPAVDSPTAASVSPRSLKETLQSAQQHTNDAITLTGRRLSAAVRKGDLGAAEAAASSLAVTLIKVTEVVGTQLLSAGGPEGDAAGGASVGILSSCTGARSESGASLAEKFAELVTTPAAAAAPPGPDGAQPAGAAGGAAAVVLNLSGVQAALTDTAGKVSAALTDFMTEDEEVPESVRRARARPRDARALPLVAAPPQFAWDAPRQGCASRRG